MHAYTGISLQESCVPHDAVPQFNLPDFVVKYCDDVKTRYVQQSILPDSDWPPSLGGQYVRLALIKQQRSLYYHTPDSVIEHQIDYTRGDYDKIMERKTKIELINAFDRAFCDGGGEIALRMLVDGAPGVGKTTLSRKVSSMWANGEILQRYWLVLLLHLREKAISKAMTIDELFYHDDSKLQQSIIEYVKERSGDGVLIIFDGFDELSSYERSEESLFLDISKGKILHKCAIAITSRPYASRSLQVLPSINRHIEVLGFTDEQVKVCIMKKIKDRDKAKELCTELKDRLDIASICQIPLNCSLVLYVYEQEHYRLPRTLTELYELFILHSLKRFLGRNLSGEAADELLQLDQLPSLYQKCFLSLCELALKGLREDKLVFSKQDLDAVFPLECRGSDRGLPVLDLMTSAKSYSSRSGQDTHSFLHLTIQEFLAAYRLACYSSDADKLKFCQQNMIESRYRMVLLFFSGLTKLEFPNVSSVFSQLSWKDDKVQICQLTYEAGNQSVCRDIAVNHSFDRRIELTGSRFDKLVVSDFVANSDCQWQEVKFKPNDSRLIHKVFSTCRESTTCIENMSVKFDCRDGNANLTPVRLLDVLPQVSMVTIVVKFAERSTKFDNKSDLLFIKNTSEFFTGTQHVQYKKYSIYLSRKDFECTLHYSNILERFCRTLGNSLIRSTCVTKIVLDKVFSKAVHYIFAALIKNTSSSHLKSLICTKGYVSVFKLGRDAVSVPFLKFCTTLAKVISHNTSLEELSLQLFDEDSIDNDRINRDGIDSITSALVHNTTLQKLIFVQEEFLFERNQETRVMELKCTQEYKEKLSLTPSVILGESSKQNESPSEAPPAKRPRSDCSSPQSVSDSTPTSPPTSPPMEPEVSVTPESSPSQTQVFQQSTAVEYSSAEPSQVPYPTLSSDKSTTSHQFASNQTQSIYSHAVSHELSTSHACQQNLMANAVSLSLSSHSQECVLIEGPSFNQGSSDSSSSQVSSPIPSSFIGAAGHQSTTRSNYTSHEHSVSLPHLSSASVSSQPDLTAALEDSQLSAITTSQAVPPCDISTVGHLIHDHDTSHNHSVAQHHQPGMSSLCQQPPQTYRGNTAFEFSASHASYQHPTGIRVGSNQVRHSGGSCDEPVGQPQSLATDPLLPVSSQYQPQEQRRSITECSSIGASFGEPPQSTTIASSLEHSSVFPHSMPYHVNPEIASVPQPTGGSSFVSQAPTSRNLPQKRPPAYPHYVYPQMFPPQAAVLMSYPCLVPWPLHNYQIPPPNQQQVNPYPYLLQPPHHQQPTTSSQSVSTAITTTTTN